MYLYDKNMTCAPVSVGLEFKFNFRRCRITAVHYECFDYVFVNPALENGRRKTITFRYWQDNMYKLGDVCILKGDKVPVALQCPNAFLQRENKRLKQIINTLIWANSRM